MQLYSIFTKQPTECPPIPLNTVDKYKKENRIGEGTYGIVYRASQKSTLKQFALKKIRLDPQDNEGLPISSLREISLLSKLSHKNIVSVIETVVGDSLLDIFLVMEYCNQDMAYLLDSMHSKNLFFKPPEVKSLLSQLLNGINFLHSNFIIHRDLKMSNLLITDDGILKVADFGLARYFNIPIEPMTPKVVTLWYRAPELLFGELLYTDKIDIWSIGCIFSEWILGQPLLPGKIEQEQVSLICNLLGSPNASIWPKLPELPFYRIINFPYIQYSSTKQVFQKQTKQTIDLIEMFLTYDPEMRCNLKDARNHGYFNELPRPCVESLIPTYPEFRNGELKVSRNEVKLDREQKDKDFKEFGLEPIGSLPARYDL